MEQKTNLAHGVKWGLIIGVLYMAFIYVRYAVGEYNPELISSMVLVTYILVIALMVAEGITLRKKAGGQIEVKEAFKVLFLSVLLFEACFILFNFIYLKYINPDFFHVFKAKAAVALKATSIPPAKVTEILNGINENAGRDTTIFDLLKTYLIGISMSGIVALIISLLLKRRSSTSTNRSLS